MNCSTCSAKLESGYPFCSKCGTSADSTRKINPTLANIFNWISRPAAGYVIGAVAVALILVASTFGLSNAWVIALIALVLFRVLREFATKGVKKQTPRTVLNQTTPETDTSTTTGTVYVRAKRNSVSGIVGIALGLLILVTRSVWTPRTNNAGSDSFYSFIGISFGVILIATGALWLAIGGIQSAINQAKKNKMGL